MKPTIEIEQYGEFFEVIYRDGVDPGCLKFSGNAHYIRKTLLFRIGKLGIDLEEIVCDHRAWQKIKKK